MDMLGGSPETGHVLIFFLETEMKNASVMMNKHKIVNSTVLVGYFKIPIYKLPNSVPSRKFYTLIITC